MNDISARNGKRWQINLTQKDAGDLPRANVRLDRIQPFPVSALAYAEFPAIHDPSSLVDFRT